MLAPGRWLTYSGRVARSERALDTLVSSCCASHRDLGEIVVDRFDRPPCELGGSDDPLYEVVDAARRIEFAKQRCEPIDAVVDAFVTALDEPVRVAHEQGAGRERAVHRRGAAGGDGAKHWDPRIEGSLDGAVRQTQQRWRMAGAEDSNAVMLRFYVDELCSREQPIFS